ncbi:MAG: MFS transporter [Solirubrobacterales bacterium]
MQSATSSVGDSPELRFASTAGRWVLAATIVGSAVAQITGTVVNVGLPAIGEDLGADLADLQWVINGYLLTLAALILVGGSLGDRFGRRRVFQIGVIWFATASLACAAAPTIEVLVAARILQGIGGALLTPGSLSIIQATFRRADRARAIGAWAALGGIGAAIGPLLGGYLIDAISWRAVFLINLPLAAFVVYAAARHVPESREPEPRPLDRPGAALAIIGLAGATYALIGAPDRGLGSPAVLIAAAVGLAALAGFGYVQRTSEHPMMPLSAFANRQFSAANALTFVVYGALGGVFFLFVVFLQVVLDYSALQAGAASLPITVIMLLLSERAGELAERIGPRWPLTVGPLLIAGGMVLLGQIDPGASYATGVLPGLVVFGLGLAATVAPVTSTALAAADQRHTGVASGINNAVARTAGLIAVAVLPWIAGLSGQAYDDPDALGRGFEIAMWSTAGLAAAGALLAAVTISSDLLEEDADTAEGTGAGTADGRADHDGGRHVARGCAIDGPPPCWDEDRVAPTQTEAPAVAT